MIYFRAFIQANITDTDIVSFLKKKYNAQIKAVFKDLKCTEDIVVSETSVRIGALAFTMKITQYLAEDASENAAEEIYLGTAKVKDAKHLTQVLFNGFAPFSGDLFLEVMTNIISYFGGGYLTSDVYNEIIRTYAIIDKVANKGKFDEHTDIFL